ncbi:maltose alpha-D-glucosyltransferase [Dactylosporangium sp. NPDC051541]|uniref:maltose alpha-D-glucosyltransferase n=1 Tax=Dactylosporangium sp. NPDC051541 TaxID=3363977 RepID=UPI0037B0B7C8
MGDDGDGYVEWLRDRSMLAKAERISGGFSGVSSVWQTPFGRPNPSGVVGRSSVWFTAYPPSMITKPGHGFLGTLGDEELWRAFAAIGISAVHTGPLKRAGGLFGREPTPSVDGHFDRIGTEIDEVFGTEDEFRRLCAVAAAHGGIVIDDIVPGHTGKGPDFRLAEMKVGDYPGIYHMVEIPPADWHLLPAVAPGHDSVNLTADAERRLHEAGYIVGRLQRVLFQEGGVKDTNWSATAEVEGVDGVRRRWVYLHYFKDGQPSINWLDPTFAGMRLVIGDALHSLDQLGASALRLDANGFLGVERGGRPGAPAWSEGHPLSEAVNQLIASMVRKVGGFTFQELNLSIEDIRQTSARGPDLSYDFVNRPAYVHALATADTEFLRLTLNLALRLGLPPARLVHALQNHDELTYELVHFAGPHRDEPFTFRGTELSGTDLAATVRADLVERLTGAAAPYNRIFTTNGIAATMATIAAAVLGHRDLAGLTADQVARVRRAHLLLAMFNAWQPGVFAVSGWDLCGMLTLPAARIPGLLATGDTRWINRAAYDLMDYRPEVTESPSRIPRGASLYGSLPQQLADPDSFVAQLAAILRVRAELGLAAAVQLDVPPAGDPAVLVMVHRLDGGRAQATVLNFAGRAVTARLRSEHLPAGAAVHDALTGGLVGEMDAEHGCRVVLRPHEGRALLLG